MGGVNQREELIERTGLIAMANAMREQLGEKPKNGSILGLWFATADALEATIKEMHARELHHFEEEKLRAEAEAERDALRAALGEIRSNMWRYCLEYTGDGHSDPVEVILSRALDTKEKPDA